MNLFKIIKPIPLLFTLIIIIFFNITHQKQYAKLKILIWNTPSLSLGRYLAISTGTGFLLSYIISTGLIKAKKTKLKTNINTPLNNDIQFNEEYETVENEMIFDNTLIERDVNDPSPTIKANFRVIGKTSKRTPLENEETDEYNESQFSKEYDKIYSNKEDSYKSDKKNKIILDDWKDDSYLHW